MRWVALWAALVLIAASPAHAGPAVAFIGSVFSAALAPTITGALVRIGAGLALSALSRARQGKAESIKAPGLFSEYTDGESTPLTVSFGYTAVRGHKIGPAYSHGEGSTPNKYLSRPSILSDLPITSIEQIIIEGEEHTPTGGTAVTGKFADSFRLMDRKLGPNSSTSSYMLSNYGAGQRAWQSDMIGRDIAWVVPQMKTDRDGDNFTSEPFPLWVIRAASLYDRREDDEVFTENPVVMIENILRGVEIDGIGTWGMHATDDDLSEAGGWSTSMDVCDELTSGEKRYRAGLEFGLNQEPLRIIDELLTTCAGQIADCGGSWRISVGPPPPSVYSFTDSNVIVTRSREFTPFKGLSETFNGATATYRDPRNAWEATQAKPYYNQQWETQDGGQRLVAELSYPAVPYPKQVRRLMRETVKDNRRMRSHVLSLKKAALHVMPLDTVTWTSTENGYSSKLFEVTQKAFDPYSLISEVFLRERDPSDYDFDEDFDGDLPFPPDRVREDFTIYGVAGFDAVGSAIQDGDGNDRRPCALCTWDVRDVNGLEIEIRHAASNQLLCTVQLGPGGVNVGEARIANANILPSQQLKARAKVVATRKRPTTWSPDVFFTTPGVFLGWADISAQVAAEIEAGKIDVLNSTRVARGIQPIETQFDGPLPTTGNFEERMLYRASDKTLYIYLSGAWTDLVPPVNITGVFDDIQINGVSASKLVGQITQTQVTDGAITTPKLAANAIVADKIASNAIIAAKIAADAVTSSKIAASAITAGLIAAGAVNTSELAAGAIIASKIGAGQVTADKIAVTSLSALSANLGSIQVDTAHIQDLTIGTGDINYNQVSDWQSISNIDHDEDGSDSRIRFTGLSNQYVALCFSIRAAGLGSGGSSSAGATFTRNGTAVSPEFSLTTAGSVLIPMMAAVSCVNGTNDFELVTTGVPNGGYPVFIVLLVKR